MSSACEDAQEVGKELLVVKEGEVVERKKVILVH